MTETSQKESQQADVKNETMGPPKASGLGALLRSEREKRGLSHEQVAQITRLRTHFLEAMENEEWHNLPPSVFVKGFIRSYAKALELNESKLLDLYKSMVPDEVAPPTPILEPKKSRKEVVLVLALLLGVLAVTLYLWMGKPSSKQAAVQTEKGFPSESQEKPSKKAQPVAPKSEERKPLKEQVESVDLAGARVGPEEVDVPVPVPEVREEEEYPTDEDLFVASTTESSAITDWRVLTGIVHMRTWIRIYIDDEAPKEYILQSGSRPQWKARKGFYLLVGNAAGIGFDFDGKEIKDLGELGQVVSLRLPEDFERQISED